MTKTYVEVSMGLQMKITIVFLCLKILVLPYRYFVLEHSKWCLGEGSLHHKLFWESYFGQFAQADKPPQSLCATRRISHRDSVRTNLIRPKACIVCVLEISGYEVFRCLWGPGEQLLIYWIPVQILTVIKFTQTSPWYQERQVEFLSLKFRYPQCTKN